MPTYTISGRLLNNHKQPLSGFKITAWDKDKKISDYLGTAYTGLDGAFSIAYDENRFYDDKQDNLPDIFFLVYQGDRVIHTTESHPLKNVRKSDNLEIIIDSGESVTPPETKVIYLVEGKVIVKQTAMAVPGIKVEAWDKDKKVCDQLGVSITDQKGGFYIKYDESRFKDDPKDGLPDLFFRIFSGDEMIHSTEGKPLKNVKRLKGIIIEIERSPESEESKVPNLPKEIVLDLSENKENTPSSLQTKLPEVYSGLLQKAQQKLKSIAVGFFSEAAYDLKHFAKSLDFSALTDLNQPVTEYIIEVLENSYLKPSDKSDAQKKLDTWDGPETLNDLIKPESPLKDNPVFQEELMLADMYKMADITGLKDSITQQLISRNLSPWTIGPKVIKTLTDDKVLKEDEGRILNFNANIYTLSNGNLQLYRAIKNYNSNKPADSLKDLASWEQEDWKRVLSDSATSGNEEDLEKLAILKQKQVETLYPHQVFIKKSRTFEIDGLIPLMERFYENNDSLNFLSLDYSEKSREIERINLEGFSDHDRVTILNNLKTNQRLYKITRDASATFKLKKHYSGANEITSDSFPVFFEKTGIDEPFAREYYENARRTALDLGTIMGGIIDRINDPLRDSPVENADREINSALRRLDGYEEFFGETDYCRCEHCASIISPSAYFVDLMLFLKMHVMDVHFRGRDRNHIISPYKRRSDLWNGLILNCEHTHKLVPSLTIINEILENFIYSDSNDLLPADAFPERYSVENFVYDLLSRTGEDPLFISSFKQPFHLPLAELEIYLQHFPITRESIVKILLADINDLSGTIPMAGLKLSSVQYNLIVHSGDSAFLEQLYSISIDSDGSFDDIDVQHLLSKLELTRGEFTALIDTYFIRSGTASDVGVVPGPAEDVQFKTEYLHNATVDTLDRMHRFIRLWRQLEWSVPEFDKVIYHLHDSSGLPAAERHGLFPEQMVKLVDIQKKLKINIDELCTLINEIPAQDSPSFFDKKFNLRSFIKEESDRWQNSNLSDGSLTFKHPAYITEVSEAPDTATLHRLLAGFGINDEELFLLIENLRTPLRLAETGATSGTFTLSGASLTILYRHALLLKKYKLKVEELFFLLNIEPSITENYITGFEDAVAFITLMEWYKKSNFSINELAFILNESLSGEELFDDPQSMAYDIWKQIQSEENLLFEDTLFSYVNGISESQSRAVIEANSSIIIQADLRKYRISAIVPAIFNFTIPSPLDEALSAEQQLQVSGTLLKLISEQLAPSAMPLASNALSLIQGIDDTISQQILASNNTIFALVPGSSDQYELTPGARSAPGTLNISIPPAIAGILSPEDNQILYMFIADRISSYILPGAPEVSDRLFVGIAGLGLEGSREIIAANPVLFEPVESTAKYWLSPDFNIASSIHIPADVPLPIDEARALLVARHISTLFLNAVATRLSSSSEKLKILALFAAYDFENAALSSQFTLIAQATETLTTWEEVINILQKLTIWFKDNAFDYDALEFIRLNSGGDNNLFKADLPDDYRSPSLLNLHETELYRLLRKDLSGETGNFHTALSGYIYDAVTPHFSEEVTGEMSAILNAESSLVTVLNSIIAFPNTNESATLSNEGLKALNKFGEIVQLVQFLGIGGEVLPGFISNDFNDLATAVKAIIAAIRTKYDTEEEWENKIGPFEDKIRELKRDALTDHLLHTFRYDDVDRPEEENLQMFESNHDLYNYFLIDTELMGCARTSRVVAGIASLQLYIQRCLMNLEQSKDGLTRVLPENIPAGEWEWRKNYRVWEANRKVFLYPENYIEPDLRDNKTELFSGLENTLLQQQINAQNSLDAYARYMKGFEEVASLKIAGAYHHLDLDGLSNAATIKEAADTLHVFGVTASEPPVYYYRTIKNIYKREKKWREFGVRYNPWKKINIQIPVKRVSPIVYKGKLYLFWVQVTTRPRPESDWRSSEAAEYIHTFQTKFSYLQLDDTWTSPQPVLIRESPYHRWTQITVMPEVDENHTIRNWKYTGVYPSIEERTGRLILKNYFLHNALILYTREIGETIISDSYPLVIPVKRPLKDQNAIGYWERGSSYYGFKYYSSNEVFMNDILFSASEATLAQFNGETVDFDLINGSLSDVLVNNNNDLLHLHAVPSVKPYAINRLGTTLSDMMSVRLFEYGINSLLDIDYQKDEITENSPLAAIEEDYVWNDINLIPSKGAMSVYFREIFFHIPFLIANHLNSQGKYSDAQRWYHYIFNPTASNIAESPGSNPSDRVWQYIEFRNLSIDTWYDNLNDEQAIQAYETDPFNPHAIARLRIGSYKKTIVMKYIDNLLDWGDQLFAQDSMESINEATLLYVMASEILGKRPAELGDCDKGENNKTFEDINSIMDGAKCKNFLNSIENSINRGSERISVADSESYIGGSFILEAENTIRSKYLFMTFDVHGSSPLESIGSTSGMPSIDTSLTEGGYLAGKDFLGMDWKGKAGSILDILSFHTSFLKQTCLFCIPPNPDLMAYWDRLEDRLYKIRNCMNFSGIRRQIPLFSPEIDPRLLVRAKAAGLSIDEILNSAQGELPPYRFAFLLAKAKEYAGAVQGFGAALLGALDKKSGEELSLLRFAQQDEVLKMTSRLRDLEISSAEASLEGIRRREITIRNRLTYYEELINTGLNPEEQGSINTKNVSHVLRELSIIPMLLSGNLRFFPAIAGFSISTPPDSAANAGEAIASFLQYSSHVLDILSQMQSLNGSNKRREEGWQFSLDQASNELLEIEKQIEAAEIRRDISVKARELHEKSIEQHQETYEFYRDKFTSLGLYTWMSSQLQRMYRETYQNAMTIARMAERAYRFERNDDTSVLLDGNYWDASRAGLMAGETIMNALRHMELRYMETHTRSMEIDQAFSLTQIDPSSLLALKTTGKCEFTVPELYFDLFYPGQYRRSVKSARLTIPCITGPYSNVSAVMTLKGSYIRKDPKLDTEDKSELILVPASRSATVATSTAQNDSGVFRLDFRDERYMPFEGAGAVNSSWQIELPDTFRPFNYDSINDVILHISYTAEYDSEFRNSIEGETGRLNEILSGSNFTLPRAFSFRQEFSQTFHRLLHSPVGEIVPLELSEKHFPLFLQGKQLQFESVELILEPDENGFRNADGEIVFPPALFGLGIGIQANGTEVVTNISDWRKDGGTNTLRASVAAIVFAPFMTVVQPLRINLSIIDAGIFAPGTPIASDPSALDDHKVKDVYLILNYKIVT